uniref:Cystatin domain-containing protein n=1 Tax=Bursaphelenchus xylophilus TaxID=6326 RepID=A0A1I7SQE8_BURXY
MLKLCLVAACTILAVVSSGKAMPPPDLENDPNVQKLAKDGVAQYAKEHNKMVGFVKVTKATRRIVAGTEYSLDIDALIIKPHSKVGIPLHDDIFINPRGVTKFD